MPKPKKEGRPSKFRKAFCKQLEDWMAQGMSFRSFGAEVDCTEETLHDWCEKFPMFSESKKRGELRSSKFFERLGTMIMTGKVPNANAAVYIFTMKNKHMWTDRHEITGQNDKPLVLKYALDQIPEKLKPEDSEESSEGE